MFIVRSFNNRLHNLSSSIIMPFYAVAKGKPSGIFTSWEECKSAIDGVKHAKYKKFGTKSEAQEFIDQFKGHVMKPTSLKVLDSPSPPPRSATPEDLLEDDLDDLLASTPVEADDPFVAHAIKIESMIDDFKTSIIEEIERFKSTLLSSHSSGSLIPQRNFSSVAKSKRKSTTVTDSKPKKPKYELPVDEDGFVHVFTDGACENNGRVNAKAGLGVWFGENHPMNVSLPVKGRATNNVGEIQACTQAINKALEAGVTKLCINTDSQFVINSMTTWLKNWKNRGWKLKDGGDVKNKYDFMELDKAMQLMEVKFNYVKGHAGIEGNEGADQLARMGAQQYDK